MTAVNTVNIQENVALAPYTTLKVGGPAEFFVEISSSIELLEVLKIAEENHWPIFILAGGSNLIVADRGFKGLVIKLNLQSLTLNGQHLTAGASTPMSEIVEAAVNEGLAGLEWAGGLPGTFGGAIRGNAGCFGGEIKDSVLMVKSIKMKEGKEVIRDDSACKFGYRDSIFKTCEEVIIEATLQLKAGSKEELAKMVADHIEYRRQRHPLEFPNAGSIFKNVPLEKVPKEHLPLFEEAIKNDPFPIVPTAKIIAVAGLKGLRVGETQVSEKHTNMFVNLGHASAADLLKLIDKVKQEIKQRYQINLEIEPELVGF